MLERLLTHRGIHTADLFVIAGRPLPPDLAPAGNTGPLRVTDVVRAAMKLYGDQFDRLHDLIRSAPVQPPSEPPPRPQGLLRGLLENRNMGNPGAQLLKTIGDGPYVSDSTVGKVAAGLLPLTPQYVTAFAALLGFDAADLAAVTGVGPPVATAKLYPRHARLAALAWDARRLSGDQLRQALDLAAGLARPGRRG